MHDLCTAGVGWEEEGGIGVITPASASEYTGWGTQMVVRSAPSVLCLAVFQHGGQVCVLAIEAQDGLGGGNRVQKGSSKVPSGTPGVVFEE